MSVWQHIYQTSPALVLCFNKFPKTNHASLKDARSHLVSIKTAEAIFERFDFSEYKGCQIVDMNPGLGIFSAHLNAAVQPSKHILLEPKSHYDRVMDALCRSSPSYTRCKLDGYNWNTYNTISNSGLLNPRIVPPEDGVNTDLLFTANIPHNVQGTRFLNQIIASIAQKQWLMKYGRVRMLVWCTDAERARFIPRMVKKRHKAAVMVELLTQCLELAAGEFDIPGKYLDEEGWWREMSHKEIAKAKRERVKKERMEMELETMETPRQPSAEEREEPRSYGGTRSHKYKDMIGPIQLGRPVMHSSTKLTERPDFMSYLKMPQHPSTINLELNDFINLPKLKGDEPPSLISFTPGLLPPFLETDDPFSTDSPWLIFKYLTGKLFSLKMQPFVEALKTVGPGAGTLLETDEELKALNIAQKPVMHLSTDELAVVHQAYERWPFRKRGYFDDDWTTDDER